MKRVITLLLAFVLMISMCACGSKELSAEESLSYGYTAESDNQYVIATTKSELSIGRGTIAGSNSSTQKKNNNDNKEIQPKELISIYEDENCAIQYYKCEMDSNRVKMLFRVSNKTNRILTFQSDCIAINGESIEDTSLSDKIAPNSSGTITMKLNNYDKEYFDFEHISSLSGNFTIIDFNDKNFYNGSSLYKIAYSNILIPDSGTPIVSGEQGQEFYSDDNVDLAFLSIKDNDDTTNVYFRVKNKTNRVLTIQCSSMCINGESAQKISASESIAPCSTGNINIKCIFNRDFVDFDTITSISGGLKIIDFQNDEFYNGKQLYEVIF